MAEFVNLSDLIANDVAKHYAGLLGPEATTPAPRIEVQKIACTVPVSTELAMDAGLIPDTREPVKISRRQRMRWAFAEWRSRQRMRAASWLAGFDVEDRY